MTVVYTIIATVLVFCAIVFWCACVDGKRRDEAQRRAFREWLHRGRDG